MIGLSARRSSVAACAVVAASFALVLGPARPARAGDAEMRAYFDEGRALESAGNLREAIDRFEKSLAEKPSVGALLNLGDCHDKLGEPARAYVRFRDAEALAIDRDPGRIGEGKKRADAVRPKIGLVVLDAAPPGLTVTVDGAPALRIGDEIALPPGSRTLAFAAPDREPRTMTFAIAAGATRRLRVADGVLGPATSAPPPPPPPEEETSAQRTIGWTLVAIGGAGVVASLVLGGVAAGQKSKLEDLCPMYPTCAAKDRSDAVGFDDAAHGAATGATISIIAGAALAALGVVLVVTAPHPRESARAP